MEDAICIHRKHPAPLRIFRLGHSAGLQDAGHVDAEADRADLGLRPGHQRIDGGRVGHIQCPGMYRCLPWRRGDDRRDHIGGDHGAAAVTQLLDQGSADAAVGAGDQGDGAVESGEFHADVLCASCR
ncbi:hypothetical protein D3C71_1116470 [compost metagenome]